MISCVLIVLSIFAVNITLPEAFNRAPGNPNEYLSPNYSMSIHEIDVLSYGEPRDSIHTMMIVENSFGFNEDSDAYAVLLFRDELVLVEVDNSGSEASRKYPIPLENPFRLFCDSNGESVIIAGLPIDGVSIPLAFISLINGTASELLLELIGMYSPQLQLAGNTMLVVNEEYAQCFNVSGRVHFTTEEINRSNDVFLTDQGESLLLSRTNLGRGATVEKLDLTLEPLWIHDTGRGDVTINPIDQTHTAMYSSYTLTPDRRNRFEIAFIDLDTGATMNETVIEGSSFEHHASDNGMFWCTVVRDQALTGEVIYHLSRGFTLYGQSVSIQSKSITADSHSTLRVRGVSNKGDVLLIKSNIYDYYQYILINVKGEIVWISEIHEGSYFPTFTGLYSGNSVSTDVDVGANIRGRPQMSPDGRSVIYSDPRSIRILTFSETP